MTDEITIGTGPLQFRLLLADGKLIAEHVKTRQQFPISETQLVAWLKKRAQASIFGKEQ